MNKSNTIPQGSFEELAQKHKDELLALVADRELTDEETLGLLAALTRGLRAAGVTAPPSKEALIELLEFVRYIIMQGELIRKVARLVHEGNDKYIVGVSPDGRLFVGMNVPPEEVLATIPPLGHKDGH